MNHVIQRAWERYGLCLTVADVLAIQTAICLGRALLMKRTPASDTSIYAIKWMGLTCIVMAENATGCVRTFLPQDTSHVRRGKRRKFHDGTGHRFHGRWGKR